MPAADRTMKDKYTAESLAYSKKKELLKKIADVYGGNETLRDGADKYLPRLYIESEIEYHNRLKTLAIPNYLKDAIAGFVGRIFSKETTLAEDVPPQIVEWWDDIDRIKNKGDIFFKRVVTTGIRDGLSWVLVDVQPSQAKTLEEERALGLRPYCKHYTESDVIFAQTDEYGRIVDFRVREKYLVTESMEQVEKERIRRYTPGYCEIFEVDTEELTILELSYPDVYGVPAVPYIAGEVNGAGFSTTSPIIDMANLIIRLWRSQGEQDNSLSVARSPILLGKKLGVDELSACAKEFISTDDNEADLRWVEHSGTAIGAGMDDIKDLQAKIEYATLKPLQDTSGNKTRYEARSDDAKVTSPIRNMADAAQDMIENVLTVMAHWVNLDSGGSVTVNSNFEMLEYDSASMNSIMTLYDKNFIPRATVLEEAKRRGLLPSDLDVALTLKAADAEDNEHDEMDDINDVPDDVK